MPGSEPVVSNTSPLLNLALIDRLDLLDDQFATIHVPDGVRYNIGFAVEWTRPRYGLRCNLYLSTDVWPSVVLGALALVIWVVDRRVVQPDSSR